MCNLYSFEFLCGGRWISAVDSDRDRALRRAWEHEEMLNGGQRLPKYPVTKEYQTLIK